MSLTGSGIGGRGTVAVEHLTGAPTDEAHEGVVVTAGHAPLVGEGVAEHVWVQALDAGLGASLADQRGGYRAPSLDWPLLESRRAITSASWTR
jgi:hypothetical protein